MNRAYPDDDGRQFNAAERASQLDLAATGCLSRSPDSHRYICTVRGPHDIHRAGISLTHYIAEWDDDRSTDDPKRVEP